MKILVACEMSGRVRDAFLRRGHDAVSCDLLPSLTPGPHVVGDVTEMLLQPWDMVIAFPPCTYLSDAGRAHWNRPGRAELRKAAKQFFMACYHANSPRCCVENPKGVMNTEFRKPDQIIHPYYFGDHHMKRTCLWLRGLPRLVYHLEDCLFGKKTATAKPAPLSVDNVSYRVKNRYTTDMISGKDRQQARSLTYPAVAEAMASQWGEDYVTEVAQ